MTSLGLDGDKVDYVLYQDRILLQYSYRKENIYQDIYFSEVSNNYGGHNRIYFICPKCQKRFRFLYSRWGKFKCRICNRLNYHSQQESKQYLPGLKLKAILKDKFGISDLPIEAIARYKPPRPKGMHQKTYHKNLIILYKAQEEYQYTWISGAMRALGAMK